MARQDGQGSYEGMLAALQGNPMYAEGMRKVRCRAPAVGVAWWGKHAGRPGASPQPSRVALSGARGLMHLLTTAIPITSPLW